MFVLLGSKRDSIASVFIPNVYDMYTCFDTSPFTILVQKAETESRQRLKRLFRDEYS